MSPEAAATPRLGSEQEFDCDNHSRPSAAYSLPATLSTNDATALPRPTARLGRDPMTSPAAPPTPSRTRLVRPQLYRSLTTGSLAPDVRDLLIGLTTVTDDEGWLLWSPEEIATTLYAYQPPRRRVNDLRRRAALLESAGLLVIKPCGCAELPSLKEHHAVKGGEKNRSVWSWHERHCMAQSVGLPMPTDQSVSESGSSSSSESIDGSSSSRAPARAPEGAAGAVCSECRRPISIHDPSCPVLRSPHLAVVQ